MRRVCEGVRYAAHGFRMWFVRDLHAASPFFQHREIEVGRKIGVDGCESPRNVRVLIFDLCWSLRRCAWEEDEQAQKSLITGNK